MYRVCATDKIRWSTLLPATAEIEKINRKHYCRMSQTKPKQTQLVLPTSTLAAGLSTPIAFRIVAPSFVTWMLSFLSVDCSILSYQTNHGKRRPIQLLFTLCVRFHTLWKRSISSVWCTRTSAVLKKSQKLLCISNIWAKYCCDIHSLIN